jgi:hypothetical protein
LKLVEKEKEGDGIKHDRLGLLSMDGEGRVRVTLAKAACFDRDGVVFGEVLEGEEYLHVLHKKATPKKVTLYLENVVVL